MRQAERDVSRRFLSLRRVEWVLLALLVAFVATSPGLAQGVREGLFSRRDGLLLVFDLQEDGKPKVALVANRSPSPNPDTVNVPLFFESTAINSNESGLFRSGSFPDWTIVTFSALGESWPRQVSLRPEIQTQDPESLGARPGGSAYLISNGQVREFHYRYPTDTDLNRIAERVPPITLTLPDAIGVAIPPNSKEFAVAEGRLSIPDPVRKDERVFPGRAPDAATKYIQLAYEVPPTPAQKLLVSSGLKLAGALLPFFLLLFVPKEKVKRPGLLKWAVVASFVVMIGLLAASLAAGFRSGRLEEVLPDAIVLVIGILAAAITFAVKKD
jgi:hypothetical protein